MSALEEFSGTFHVLDGGVDVTTGHGIAYSVDLENGCDVSIDPSTGVYTITSVTQDTASAIFKAAYGETTLYRGFSVAKARAGEPAPHSPEAQISPDTLIIPAAASGLVSDYSQAVAQFTVRDGGDDVSSYFTLSTAPSGNPQALTVNYSGREVRIAAGFEDEDSAILTVRATGSGPYAGIELTDLLVVVKTKDVSGIIEDINDIKVDVQDLIDTYGSVASAQDSAALADQARQLAQDAAAVSQTASGLATGAVASARMLLPSTFELGNTYFSNIYNVENPPAATSPKTLFGDVPGAGKIVSFTGADQLTTRGYERVIAGRTYRATIQGYTTAPSNVRIWLSLLTYPDGNWAGYSEPAISDTFIGAADGLITRQVTWTAPAGTTAVAARPFFSTSGVSPEQPFRLYMLKIDDVTESENAADSAQASTDQAAISAAKATEAGQHAAAALESKTQASTAASNSQTYAGQANTAKNDAAGSAAAAAISQTASALALQATYPDNFNDPSAWRNYGTWGGTTTFSDGLARTVNGGSFMGRWKMPVVAGRSYSVTSRYRLTSGSGITYLGIFASDAAGNDLGVVWSSYAGNTPPAAGTWTVGTGSITGDTILNTFPSAAFMTPVALIGYQVNGDGEASFLRLADVTSEVAASGHATVAQNASASATTQAAAAQQSATMAASVVPGSANRNPTFGDYPTANGLPNSWVWWATGGGGLVRESGLTATYAARMISVGGFNMGLMNRGDMGLRPGHWVVEAVIRLNAGTLRGAGFHIAPQDASNSAGNGEWKNFAFYAEPDFSGKVNGSGVPGSVYRFSKVFELKSTQMGTWANLYAMNHYADFASTHGSDAGDISGSNDITWYYLGVRPASAAEIAGYKSLSEVNVVSGALADIRGRQSAYLQQTASVGGSASQAILTMRADLNEPAASPLTMDISRSPDVSFVNRSVRKLAGANPNWDRAFFSVERIGVGSNGAGAYIAANAINLTSHVMFGLASSLASASYTNLDFAIYFDTSAVRVYRSGNPAANLDGNNKTTDRWSMDYVHVGGYGYVTVYKNGVQRWQSEALAQGNVYNAQVACYEIGSGVDNLVFSQGGPVSTSSIGLFAKELLLGNTEDGGDARVAMKVAGGNVAFSGNVYAGGRVILGNGETGWEMAVKPKVFSVSDGQTITWPNLGYIPNYSFSPVGLAVLGAGESYDLRLDNLSATGAIARLKISVPPAPSSYSVGPGTAGGSGAPTVVASKGATQDAVNGQYSFSGTWSATGVTKLVLNDGWKDYVATINWSITLYALVNGTWTSLRTLSGTQQEYGSGTGQSFTANGSFAETVTCPPGTTAFGVSGSSPYLSSVNWTGAGSGAGERSASPSGQVCSVTILP